MLEVVRLCEEENSGSKKMLLREASGDEILIGELGISENFRAEATASGELVK